jgi:hypothetical protein
MVKGTSEALAAEDSNFSTQIFSAFVKSLNEFLSQSIHW